MPTVPLLVRGGRGAGGGGHDSSAFPAPPRVTAAGKARPQRPDARFYWSMVCLSNSAAYERAQHQRRGRARGFRQAEGVRAGMAAGRAQELGGVRKRSDAHPEQRAAGAYETRAQRVAVGDAKCIRGAPSRRVWLHSRSCSGV